MQDKEDLSPAEKALESALGQLKPTTYTMSRDELMFNAGRATAGSKGPWQMLSGLLTVLLLGSVLIRPGSNGPRELVGPVEPAHFEMAQVVDQPAQVKSRGSLEYVTLREKVIEQGLDALPLRHGVGSAELPRSRKQLLDSMLSS
ncbi:MAG: hypothetical protein JSW47_01045 [Phycisphaerales bacterium]|nr:MAG: hypothetical protein JSW47_01045 [Phycisphaerales bacterium]